VQNNNAQQGGLDFLDKNQSTSDKTRLKPFKHLKLWNPFPAFNLST
jgi:hypothetical protein